jgi:transcriptional regulator GlxA family with amidase domain
MRRVVIVACPDAELLDVACPAGVFDGVSRWGASPPYAVELVSLGGLAIRSACGISLAAHRPLERVGGRVETLMVAGGSEAASRPLVRLGFRWAPSRAVADSARPRRCGRPFPTTM